MYIYADASIQARYTLRSLMPPRPGRSDLQSQVRIEIVTLMFWYACLAVYIVLPIINPDPLYFLSRYKSC